MNRFIGTEKNEIITIELRKYKLNNIKKIDENQNFNNDIFNYKCCVKNCSFMISFTRENLSNWKEGRDKNPIFTKTLEEHNCYSQDGNKIF